MQKTELRVIANEIKTADEPVKREAARAASFRDVVVNITIGREAT